MRRQSGTVVRLTCWYCFMSRSLIADRFRPLRLASLIAWYLVDRTKACKVQHNLQKRRERNQKDLAAGQTMSMMKYKTHSPGTTQAFASKSGWSQKHKALEDSEQHMWVSGCWAERSCRPTQSESTLLHLCASLFWRTPWIQFEKQTFNVGI